MGELEIIDILCDVTEKLSGLVRELNTALKQADIADEIKTNITQRIDQCDLKLDKAEYKMRRLGR